MSPARTVCMRHGQTDHNVARRFQGMSDVPLNEYGREQARRAAGVLAGRVTSAPASVGISASAAGAAVRVRVASSPLRRAAETAQIVVAALRQRGRPLTVSTLMSASSSVRMGVLRVRRLSRSAL